MYVTNGRTMLNGVISNDSEWPWVTFQHFSDTKRGAASLRQLSFLFQPFSAELNFDVHMKITQTDTLTLNLSTNFNGKFQSLLFRWTEIRGSQIIDREIPAIKRTVYKRRNHVDKSMESL